MQPYASNKFTQTVVTMSFSSYSVLHDFNELNVVCKEFCVFQIPQSIAIRSFRQCSTLRISKGAKYTFFIVMRKLLLKIILNRETFLTWSHIFQMQVKRLISSIVAIIILIVVLSTSKIKAINEYLEQWVRLPRLEAWFKNTTGNIQIFPFATKIQTRFHDIDHFN